jgi:hypothetical protein
MGVALMALICVAALSMIFVPVFGVPAFFYVWLVVNVALAIGGIFLLVLQKDA